VKARHAETTAYKGILILGPLLFLLAPFFAGICEARATTAVAAVASFVGSDTTTEGNWVGPYGAGGYALANGAESIPAYAVFKTPQVARCAWTASATDIRPLEASSGSGRITSAWCSQQLTFELNFTDGASHSFALYALDWNLKGRAETIQILSPATGAILDTRSISGFSSGIYLAWNITGRVRITVTPTAGPNAVIGGAFFGGSGGTTGSTANISSTTSSMGSTSGTAASAANSSSTTITSGGNTGSTGSTSVASTSSSSAITPAAIGTLSVNPASFNFGSVNVGSVASQPISVTNSGTSSVTISNVSISGPGFNASGASGAILSPGQSTTLNVTFTPASTGSMTGSITIPSNAANSPASIGLSGTGAQPPSPSHSVMLTWIPGASSGVAGYYVFRSSVGGQFTQLSSALVTATTYTDTTVQSGQSYDYAVTSVDSSNTQSAYSNVASASIP
jgi:hypothetical protein